jgi:hypothetical protein
MNSFSLVTPTSASLAHHLQTPMVGCESGGLTSLAGLHLLTPPVAASSVAAATMSGSSSASAASPKFGWDYPTTLQNDAWFSVPALANHTSTSSSSSSQSGPALSSASSSSSDAPLMLPPVQLMRPESTATSMSELESQSPMSAALSSYGLPALPLPAFPMPGVALNSYTGNVTPLSWQQQSQQQHQLQTMMMMNPLTLPVNLLQQQQQQPVESNAKVYRPKGLYNFDGNFFLFFDLHVIFCPSCSFPFCALNF